MEHHYNKRTVVHVVFSTQGCRFKKGGSCWNCNYGALESCEITPEQYIEEFKKVLVNISGNVLVFEGFGNITDQEKYREFLQNLVNQTDKASVPESREVSIPPPKFSNLFIK